MNKKISIEVYRDIETPDVDPRLAVAGIELINELTDSSLEIFDLNRKIHLSKVGAQTIKSESIRWSDSPIDIRIALTSRELEVKDDNQATIGYSHNYLVGDGGIAVVSTHGTGGVSPQSTTAHELGHIYKLRYGAEGVSHCPNTDCIMHANLKTQHETRRIPKHGLQGWRERKGYQIAEYQTVEEVVNSSFCDPCQNQLAKRAFFMVARKNGIAIADNS